jgi:hypothetical protein
MTPERLDDDLGDLLMFLVGEEEAGTGDGDHAVFGYAPSVRRSSSMSAVALRGVHDPGGHTRVTEPSSRRVGAAEVRNKSNSYR